MGPSISCESKIFRNTNISNPLIRNDQSARNAIFLILRLYWMDDLYLPSCALLNALLLLLSRGLFRTPPCIYDEEFLLKYLTIWPLAIFAKSLHRSITSVFCVVIRTSLEKSERKTDIQRKWTLTLFRRFAHHFFVMHPPLMPFFTFSVNPSHFWMNRKR